MGQDKNWTRRTPGPAPRYVHISVAVKDGGRTRKGHGATAKVSDEARLRKRRDIRKKIKAEIRDQNRIAQQTAALK